MTTRAPDYFVGRPDRVAALRAECESWRGTPFRKNSRVKGARGGVDCANYVAACFTGIGAVTTPILVPDYWINHAQHSDESRLRAWFEQPAVRARVRRLDEDEPHVDGDLVFPKVGLCEHHLAIRIGQLVYHVARPSGWCAMTLAQLRFHRSRYRLTGTLTPQPSALS